MIKWTIEKAAAFISIVGIAWTAIRYINSLRQQIKQKRFKNYHTLIKELVQPDSGINQMYLDRQMAVAFELRNFPEYYELSLRLLEGLYNSWKQGGQTNRLLDEIQMTIAYIRERRKSLWNRFCFVITYPI